MTTLYFETPTDLLAAKANEYFGRVLAAVQSKPWPIPPDEWPGWNATPPSEPPVDSYTLYWVELKPKVGGGAVFELDPDLITNATDPIELSDDEEYFPDLATNAKTFEQLSAAGQAAITPP